MSVFGVWGKNSLDTFCFFRFIPSFSAGGLAAREKCFTERRTPTDGPQRGRTAQLKNMCTISDLLTYRNGAGSV